MKQAHYIKLHVSLWTMLAAVCIASAPAMAWDQNPQGRDMGCSPTIASPCTGGSSGSGGGYSPPSYDYGAARRAQEAEARREQEAEAAAAAKRQQEKEEAERIERERIAEEERKKAEFIRARDATVLKGSSGISTPHLKGIAGSELRGSNNPYGLKDAVRDTELRGLSQNDGVPAKQAAAWKQLHCAANIAKYALAKLQTDVNFNEFGYLSVEASKALDGQHTDVVCEKAPAFPNTNGRDVNMDRVMASERQILERATAIAERMQKRGDKPLIRPATKPPANESEIDRVRREQRELNDIKTKITGKTQQEINQQLKDQKDLEKLVLQNNNLESGKFVNRSYGGLDEGDVPSPVFKE